MPGKIYTIGCEDAIAFLVEAAWGFAEVDAGGNFVWVNRAFCEILNAPPDLILGTHFSQWTHRDDVAVNTALTEQVRSGLIPGYTLAKRYLQRGSTPQREMIVWGMLSVQGKRSTTGEFAGYRAQFRPYLDNHQVRIQLDLKKITAWTIVNWRTILTVIVVSSTLILGGSDKLLEVLRKAKTTADTVGSVLDSSPSGASPVPR